MDFRSLLSVFGFSENVNFLVDSAANTHSEFGFFGEQFIWIVLHAQEELGDHIWHAFQIYTRIFFVFWGSGSTWFQESSVDKVPLR